MGVFGKLKEERLSNCNLILEEKLKDEHLAISRLFLIEHNHITLETDLIIIIYLLTSN